MKHHHHHPYHFTLLNEIHAQRYAKLDCEVKHFTPTELAKICESIGDAPTWDKTSQLSLLAAALAAMAAADENLQSALAQQESAQ